MTELEAAVSVEEGNPLFDKLLDLGANMPEEGFILEALRYVLQPLVGTLPTKELHELFFFQLEPKFGRDTALAYLWFGLSVLKEVVINKDDLLPFFTSDTRLEITDGEIMCRKLLAEIAGRLASDSDTAKKFIDYVLIKHNAKFKGRARYTLEASDHRKKAHFGYFHSLLTLLTDADDQCIIGQKNLAPLVEWLSANGKQKLALIVSSSDKSFTKNFTAGNSVPELQRQCSSNSGPVEGGQNDDLDSLNENGGATQKREKYKSAKEESSGSTDEVGQNKSSLVF